MSDEEILIERMREWADSQSCSGPYPMHQPVTPVKTAVLPSIWKVQGSEVLDTPEVQQEGSGWRSRKPQL